MTTRYDAIVIGTGVSGLTAGLTMQRAGKAVLLLEAGKSFGGLLNPFHRKGYHFDVGMHYVGECGQGQYLRRMLDSLELDDIHFREITPDCIDRYMFDGYQVDVVKGLERWCDVLARDFPREKRNIWRFARLLRATDTLVRLCFDPPTRRDFARLARAPVRLASSFRVSYATVLDHYFKDPMLKGVFGASTGILGLPPSRASAYLAMVGLTHYLKGAYFPRGGGGGIRDGFVRALRARGAELMRNQEVVRIERLADGSFAVRTRSGEEFHSRVVVSGIDSRRTIEMLAGAQVDERTQRTAAKVQPSRSAFGVFLVTDMDVTTCGLNDANVWWWGSPDLERAFKASENGRVPAEPFFFMAAPTLKDPGLCIDGRHTVEMATWLPSRAYERWFDSPTKRRGAEYEAQKAEDEERLYTWATRLLPGIEGRVLMRESATPATVWSYTHAPSGSIFGPDNTPEWSPFRRFRLLSGVPGLLLAGASVNGPGIFPCVLGGLTAGRAGAAYLRTGTTARKRRGLIPRAVVLPPSGAGASHA